MFETEVFRRQMYWIEESACDIVWTFRPPPQWFGAPMVTRRPGNCSPLAPLVRRLRWSERNRSVFSQLYFFKCLMTASTGKAAVKIAMHYEKLVTASRFYNPPTWKRKTSFTAVASAVRESSLCLHRSFATWRWVDEFLDGTNPLIEP